MLLGVDVRAGIMLLLFAALGCGDAEVSPVPERVEAPASLQAWEARAAAIHEGMRDKLGLYRTDGPPGRVIRHDRRVRAGYSVENVAFESLPGHHVTGNLYLPVGRPGPRPVVLSPHGHFDEPGWSARTRPELQIRCAELARMGAIVFAWDMVGLGESTAIPHDSSIVPALQTWNSLRAVDFVLGLPDADPERILVAGASGGATQAIALLAFDPRPAATALVAMVSSTESGGCPCEDLYPEWLGLHGNLEAAALAAPAPMLIVSVGEDWTRLTPVVELPYLERIYALYGREDDVESVHLTFEGHDFGPSKREALYRFAAERLGLQAPPLPGVATLELHESLLVWDVRHPRPADEIRDEASLAEVLYRATGAMP